VDYIRFCKSSKKCLRREDLLPGPHRNPKRFSKDEFRRLMNFTSFQVMATMPVGKMRRNSQIMINLGYWDEEKKEPSVHINSFLLRVDLCNAGGFENSYTVVKTHMVTIKWWIISSPKAKDT
jgi:hypothetical protein